MWITGVVLLSVGLENKSAYDEYPPAAYFEFVKNGCKVLSRAHVASQRHDKNPYCVDVYTYNFTRGDSPSGPFYLSGPDENSRGKGTHCDDSSQKPSSLPVSAVVSCWKPTPGKTRAVLDSFYKCGNTACLKVLNPVTEYEDHMGNATLLLVLGAVFLAVGILAYASLGYLTWRCRTREEGLEVQEVPCVLLESGNCKRGDTEVQPPVGGAMV